MDNTVKVWDVLTGECLQSLTGHTSLVGLLGISPNYLVSGAADASVRIWDANTHELKHTLASHSGAITCFQHDETKVVSGSDGTLKLWDIRTGQYIRDLVIGISSVWQVAFNGNLLVAASNRGGSTVFDVFDFSPANADKRQYPMDDYKLDRLGRPAWERNNPREPQAYQVDEMDGLESSSPADMMNYFASPERADRYSRDREPGISRSKHGESSTTRRSSRLAARTSASAATGMPGWTGHLSEIEPGQSQGQSHGSSQTQGSSSRRHVKRILSRPGPSDHGHGHGHIQRLNRIAQQGSPTPIGPSGSNGGLGGSGVAGPSTRASGNAGGMGMGIRASGSSADQGRSFPPIFDEGDELMDEYVKTEDEGDGAGGSGSGGGEVDQLAEGNVEQIDQERDQWDV
jgi:F-box and WD-40 domain protein CDC4